MIYTGYIDSEREPIKVGDYMTNGSELFVGCVEDSKYGFILSYGDTFDELSSLNNQYHIISEEYADFLHRIKCGR